MWLKRILDTHASQAWDAEPMDIGEREDEELNDLWIEIGDCHKQRLWGLSSDLNTLRDRETWVESDWPPMTKEELGRAQSESFQRKDWDSFLEYLRRPPRFLPQNMVDYLRGRAWMAMGHPEVALLFFDNAARLESANSTYGVLALECLKAMQDWPEVLKRCEANLQDPATPARLLFRTADALHVYANHTGEHQFYHEALRAIEKGFGRLDQAGQQEPLSSILAGAYATKSLCLEHLDRAEESLQVFDEAVQRFPENTTLLTARGLLKQELGIADAVDDFRQAVTRGTPVVWSYIELARFELQEGRNQEAVDLCRRGIALAQRDNVAAILFELLAIALLRLNDSREAVRAAFQTAGELDPLSEEIRSNCERFESFTAKPEMGEPQWQLDPTPSEIAIDEVYAQLQAAA
jgi:tetratricopeptide (TPR) repeat protein